MKDSSYFLNMRVVGWINAFETRKYQEIIADSLRECINKYGLKVSAYCIMPNQIYLVAKSESKDSIEEIIKRFKKETAAKVIQQMKSDGDTSFQSYLKRFAKAAWNKVRSKYKFWQTGNQAIELKTDYFKWIKIKDIHDNPVKAGYVHRPEEWEYSSARNYSGQPAPIQEVHLLQKSA